MALLVVCALVWGSMGRDEKPATIESADETALAAVAIRDYSVDGVTSILEVPVPANSTLVVTSLDLSAAKHAVEISARPPAAGIEFAIDSQSSDAHCDSHRAVADFERSNWARFRSQQRSLSDDRSSDDDEPVADSCPVRMQRRFEVPHFANGMTLSRYVMAELIGAEQSLAVYSDLASVSVTKLTDRLADLACEGLPQFVEAQVGPIADVDHDSHLTILLTSLSSPVQRNVGLEPVNGCVRQSDFRNPMDGFGGDVIYLDVRLADHEQLDAVFAHELTHAAIFSHSGTENGESNMIPSWLNEGLAHCVERMVRPESRNLTTRLNSYLLAPHRSPVVIPDNFGELSLRRGPARAAACLFLESTFRSNNVEQISDLFVNGCGSTLDTLQKLTGRSLADSIAAWAPECCMQYSVSAKPLRCDETIPLSIRGTAFAAFRIESDMVVTLQSSPESNLRTAIVSD